MNAYRVPAPIVAVSSPEPTFMHRFMHLFGRGLWTITKEVFDKPSSTVFFEMHCLECGRDYRVTARVTQCADGRNKFSSFKGKRIHSK